jgi:hypothetical protein
MKMKLNPASIQERAEDITEEMREIIQNKTGELKTNEIKKERMKNKIAVAER